MGQEAGIRKQEAVMGQEVGIRKQEAVMSQVIGGRFLESVWREGRRSRSACPSLVAQA